MLCNFERTSVEDIGQKEKERDKEKERACIITALLSCYCALDCIKFNTTSFNTDTLDTDILPR